MKGDLEISLDLPSPFWDALDDEDLGLAQCILMEAMTTSSQGVAEHQENNSFLTTRLPWCELHDVKWDLCASDAQSGATAAENRRAALWARVDALQEQEEELQKMVDDAAKALADCKNSP